LLLAVRCKIRLLVLFPPRLADAAEIILLTEPAAVRAVAVALQIMLLFEPGKAVLLLREGQEETLEEKTRLVAVAVVPVAWELAAEVGPAQLGALEFLLQLPELPYSAQAVEEAALTVLLVALAAMAAAEQGGAMLREITAYPEELTLAAAEEGDEVVLAAPAAGAQGVPA
jgi:hypothetical protein